ncbi:MAG: hypothetical protein HC779_05265 [Phyllobacteriaceae bacterium]|nr:hypothetical protein [Phyllobacteriaceae bacterium]
MISQTGIMHFSLPAPIVYRQPQATQDKVCCLRSSSCVIVQLLLIESRMAATIVNNERHQFEQPNF